MSKTSTWARIAIASAVLVSTPTLVRAQASSPWSVDLAIGWDNSVSGEFLTGGIGTLQGAPVVLENKTWDEVYGTGILFNVAVGYDLGPRAELRAGLTMQSTGSDDTQTIGTFSGGPLFADFDNYKAWTIDFGYRRYFAERAERFRPYIRFDRPAVGVARDAEEHHVACAEGRDANLRQQRPPRRRHRGSMIRVATGVAERGHPFGDARSVVSAGPNATRTVCLPMSLRNGQPSLDHA